MITGIPKKFEDVENLVLEEWRGHVAYRWIALNDKSFEIYIYLAMIIIPTLARTISVRITEISTDFS